MENTNFNYFYANENEQYLFLQMPMMLIKDDRFKKLSGDDKILYSLLLNRTALSAKNGWLDDEGRVYIIYTIDEIMNDLNCYQEKANKSMKALKEIGLIKTIRQGLTKPNLIYLLNWETTESAKSENFDDKYITYRFKNKNEEIIYVGQTKQSLSERLKNHKHLPLDCYENTKIVEYLEFQNKIDMDIAEKYFISKFLPLYNTVYINSNMNLIIPDLDNAKWTTWEVI